MSRFMNRNQVINSKQAYVYLFNSNLNFNRVFRILNFYHDRGR